MEKNEVIELRSEKVRSIIGRIPPLLIRSGITIIVVILIGFLTASAYISYPENILINIEIINCETENNVKVISYIPYLFITKIKEGLLVRIELEGYDSHLFGTLDGHISIIDNNVVKKEGENFFMVIINLDDSTSHKLIPLKHGLNGIGYILISNDSILKHISKSILNNKE
ncbi:MAG TPA: HlyD family secretion protein [Porphyromonadaceae bacterium]|jgi:hypothetical protein|nr:HlyD family secretion protein [Porphyromonadaceae bacterium]HBX20650.1 HlyD family secretion protein [Porphyromonadaceae bacterium]